MELARLVAALASLVGLLMLSIGFFWSIQEVEEELDQQVRSGFISIRIMVVGAVFLIVGSLYLLQ